MHSAAYQRIDYFFGNKEHSHLLYTEFGRCRMPAGAPKLYDIYLADGSTISLNG